MDTLFDPSSIAVVGASSDEDKIGGRPIKYLRRHGYPGEIYPVNPNHDEIAGLRSYPDVDAVPETPDLALVILPATLVLDAVEECLEAGTRNVLIISSGFSETRTDEGIEAERRLAAWADEYGANIVGPNSQGVVNFHAPVAASFTPALERDELLPGSVSFVTQSGAFGGALTTIFQEHGIGLSKMVATGNEAALGALDFFGYLARDDETDVASGYIEGFNDGRKLIELKRTDAGIDMPIVLLKVGESERARNAATSHTGTMAGRQEVYRAVFRETGVIGVDDIDRFFAVNEALTELSALPGGNLGVLTTSGGAGVHIADAVEREGLSLPTLSGDTREAMGEYIPAYGSTLNPVDFTAQADIDERAEILDLLFRDDNVDTVVFQITNATGDRAVDYAEFITDTAARYDKPLFVSWTGGFEKERALSVFDGAGIPVFENPARCIGTIASIAGFADAKPRLRAAQDLPARPADHPDAETSHDDPPSVLTEVEGKALLREYGIPAVEDAVARTPDEAVEAADGVGYPVVAKLVAPDLSHRGRVGGIRTDLGGPAATREAAAALFSLADDLGLDAEVTVQPQVDGGPELALGVITASDFGPVVMVGRGGADIEEVDDVTFRTIPVVEEQARSALRELGTVDAGRLSAAQRDAVVDAVVSLSDLYLENGWIAEADVNPLVVTGDGVTAVDALFVGPDG